MVRFEVPQLLADVAEGLEDIGTDAGGGVGVRDGVLHQGVDKGGPLLLWYFDRRDLDQGTGRKEVSGGDGATGRSGEAGGGKGGIALA